MRERKPTGKRVHLIQTRVRRDELDALEREVERRRKLLPAISLSVADVVRTLVHERLEEIKSTQ